ncbi:phosphatidylserine/phosphatidylglycerophosphate/cardiolipin synthase family protein [Edaphobacter sp. 12200R-103]|uniref:phospholipase D-like domain-containing protein n=1 Tax=Edaphobacter sp. 12200R-103 TaxID=2703788 RepID=UPI001EE49F10|nr:phospholipase D-like domain-containing protein [Edaphobacter sp. 12200R-103]
MATVPMLLATVTLPTHLVVLGGVALLLLLLFLLSGLFGPMPRYKITGSEELPSNESEEFLGLLEALGDASVKRTGRFEVLTNGENFYPAELAAIREAEQSVNLEAYIFQKSQIGQLYLDALAERARAGVQVNVLLDAFGSAGITRAFFRPLLDAGGKICWYNTPAWHRLTQMDHRTHRELLIVDGLVGFIGGAGIGDHWYTGVRGHAPWRDDMVRVEGEPVANLQATFAENWLEAIGELLIGSAYFPELSSLEPTSALVINSTPSGGGATRARVLFQLLLASARHSISITTPYFLPDKGLMRELCLAVERGVQVRILVPGERSDHFLTRSTSRGGYGPLLKAGADIYEYEPAMMHAKILRVDHVWSIVGSTNFDNRSFGINDEVNLAVRDRELAARLKIDFEADLAQSTKVTLAAWKSRPIHERITEVLGWIFERQQ